MDILTQLPNLAGVGLGGTLVFVILYLLRSNYNDRAQHRETIAAIEASHKDELKARDERLVAKRQQIADLEHAIDQERTLRRRAEDAAAIAERAAMIQEARVSALQSLAEGRSNAHSPTARLDAVRPSALEPPPPPSASTEEASGA